MISKAIWEVQRAITQPAFRGSEQRGEIYGRDDARNITPATPQ